MKRVMPIVLILLTLCGCSHHREEGTTIPFCYPRRDITYGTEDGVIAWEERSFSSSSRDLNTLLRLYFMGPENPELAAPLPAGTNLTDIRWEDDTLSLCFDDGFLKLTGVKLTIAGTCIGKTCLVLTEAEHIQLCCNDGTILFSLSRNSETILFDHIPGATTPTE